VVLTSSLSEPHPLGGAQLEERRAALEVLDRGSAANAEPVFESNWPAAVIRLSIHPQDTRPST
jgi:hypothetical protein